MAIKYVNYAEKPERISDLIAFYAGTEEPLPPGYVSGPIIRDCYIFEYCHTGKGKVVINNNSFDISAGQGFFTFPGAVVSLMTDENVPWGKSWVCITGTRVRYFLDLMGINEEHPIFPWDNCSKALDEIHHIIEELKPQGEFDEFNRNICANRLFKLLLSLCREYDTKQTPRQKQSEYINRALRFIEYNYNRSITVDEIADYVGLNRTYFSTIFKEHMKQTPHQYLMDYKMNKACQFFANPNSTVASVGASIGYEPQVFSRLFKAQMGITPMQYIKKIKG